MLNRDKIRFFLLSGILIASVSFLTYFPILNSFFTGDDFGELRFGAYAKLSDALRLFFPSNQDITIRPLTLLTWFLDYRLWGLNPIGYHTVNLTMHIVNSVLVLLLVFFLSRDRLVALGAGLLFAINPIQSRIVAYIGYRYDLMCGLFYLLSLASFAFCAYKEKYRVFYFFSILCYPLALFSKEMAITLPIAIILYDVFSKKIVSPKIFKNRIKLYFPYITITLTYILWRVILTGGIGGDPNLTNGMPLFFYFHLPRYLITLVCSIFPSLFITFHFGIVRHNLYELITIGLLLGLAISIALSGKRVLKNCHLILFGFLWIFFLLFPVHFALGCVEAVFRYFYLPSVGFFIALAFIILGNKANRINKIISVVIFTVFCSIYIFATVKNNAIWTKAGEINRSIPKLVNSYYQRYGVDCKYYFLIPDNTSEGVELFSNDLPFFLAPLFAPVSQESVVLLSEGDHATDLAYITTKNFDLRQPGIMQALGNRIFFFRYNEEKAAFVDLSLHIKSELGKASGLLKYPEMPAWNLSGYVESSWMSPAVRIPANLIGAVEVKMRIKEKGLQDVGSICWHRSSDAEPLYTSFFAQRDGEFHTYRVPFTVYKPDWTGDITVTQVEIFPSSIRTKAEIEYVRLLPYGP